MSNTIPTIPPVGGDTVIGRIVNNAGNLTEEELAVRSITEQKTLDRAFMRDRAIILVRVSMWTGSKTVSTEELRAAGITNVEEYLKDHSKGGKRLVSTKQLQPISKVKGDLSTELEKISKPFHIENVRLIETSRVEEAVRQIINAERRLAEAVEKFLDEDYDKAVEAAVTKSLEKYPGIPPEQVRREFPTKDSIRRQHRVIFSILRTPENVKFSEMVDEYQLQKANEEVERYVQMTSATLRQALIGVLQGFRGIIQGKEADQKINSRSVRRVQDIFDSFLNIAPSIGDTRIAQTIRKCREKFEDASAWTREEVDELGLENIVQEVIDAASDEAAVMERQESFLTSLSIEGDFPSDSLDDSGTLEREGVEMSDFLPERPINA